MKNKLLLIVAIAISSLVIKAQTTFRISYDIANFDMSGGMIETPAGDFVVAGMNANFIPYFGNIFKIDNAGTVLWAKSYTGGIATALNDIKNVSTGGYIATGTSSSGGAILLRIDNSGNLLWAKRYQYPDKPGKASSESGNAVIETSDGGFLVGGSVDYFWDGVSANTVDTTSAMAFKVNSAGVLQWNRVWTLTNPTKADEHFISDVAESAGGYYLVGSSADETQAYNSNGDLPSQALVIKVDKATGNNIYMRRWGSAANSEGINSAITLNLGANAGKVLLGGYDNNSAFLITIDDALTSTATPALGGFNRKYNGSGLPADVLIINDIMENSDGNYSFMGTRFYITIPTFTLGTMIAKVNSSSGAIIFTRSYAPVNALSSILQEGGLCSDQGYFVSMLNQEMGGTPPVSAGFNYNIIRTNNVGQLGSGPTGCTSSSFTINTATYSVTLSTPPTTNYNSATESSFVPVVSNLTVNKYDHCLNIACTPPAAPVVGTITQPTCSTPTGSVALSGLPASGTWTVTASPGGATATGTGTTGTISGLAAGTSYTFTVTVVAGCPSLASGSATINAAPVVPTAPTIGTLTQPSCTVSTGSIALSGLPSSGTWTVTGSPSGTATGTGTTTTISGLAPGTYTFTVSNGTCTSTSSLSATLNPQPTVPTAPVVGAITQPSCSVSTGSVALSGLPSSGTWTVTASPGGSTATGTGTTTTFTGLPAGATYTFTVSNGTCTSSVSANAVINPLVGVPATPIVGTITQPTCTVATGSVALSGLPSSGTWTVTGTPSGTATGSGTTTTISGLAPGTYTFIVNDGTCNSTATTNVVINAQPTTPAAPTIGTITQPTCTVGTGSVALSGLPSSGTWTVTGSPSGTATGTGTTTTITGLNPGTYTFTVSNGTCTSTVSVNAVVNAQPTVPVAPAVGTITQPTCTVATGSVALSGLPSSGTWTVTVTPGGATSTGTGTTTTITGLTAGNTYTFTVSDGTCTSTSSTNAAINAQPTTPSAPIVGSITQPTCTVSTGDVALSGLPASGTWTITATPGGATTTGTGTSTTFTGLGAGTYTFTVNDGTCTSAASSTSATINPFAGAPTAPLIGTITQPTCAVGSASVVLNGLPSSGTWTITTTPGGATTTGTGTSTTITGLTPGVTYTFTVDNGTCTSTTSANAVVNNIPANPTATAGSPLVLGCSPSSGIVSVSTTTTGATFSWAGPGIVSGGSSASATVNAVGTYTVTVTDPATSCSSTATVNVTSNTAAPNVTAGSALTLTCAASSGTISASSTTSGATYTWTGAGIVSGGTTATPTVNAAGTYTVTVTDPSNGCTATATVTVTNNTAAPNVTAGASTPISCTTGLGAVSASSTTIGATYSWAGPGVVSGGTTATPTVNAPGTYTVTVTDPSNGCTATAIATATMSPGPTAGAGTDITITQGTSASLTATGGGTYLWSTGETTSTINVTPTQTTDYCVTVTDGAGCRDTACVRVTVDIVCGELFVPNAFSPNNDLVNDVFRVKVNPDCVLEVQLYVYDRWGEKVFEATNPDAACLKGWDGTYNGKALDNAVFVYYLNILLTNGTETQKIKGNVSLIR